MHSLDEVKNYFVYHAPTDEQRELYERMNNMWINVAEMLWENVPPLNKPSPDKTVMFRQLSDMRMQANLVIACYVPPITTLGPESPAETSSPESPGQTPDSRP